MNAIEEGGKVAIGVIDALKNQPMLLAVIILNMLVLGLVFWGIHEQRVENAALTSTLLTQLGNAQELLAKCVVPGT
jgi:hypothetical protein